MLLRRIVILSALVVCVRLDAENLPEKVMGILDSERALWGTPGIVASIIQNGRLTFTVASGFADQENKKPMTADTMVPAASISKLFTTVLVMQQVEKGTLSLDAPVNSYLEEKYWIRNRDGSSASCTLRQLLSHSSGLAPSWSGIVDKGKPVESLEEHLGKGQTLTNEPGTRIVYSNDGFSLTGLVAALAAKTDFQTYAKQSIHDPLGMRSSTWASPWSLNNDHLTVAYGGLMGGSKRAEFADVTATSPAGGLISTAPDLARFAEMLLAGGTYNGHQILKQKSIDEMWTIGVKQHPSMHTGFGLGFGIDENRIKRVWWDGGLAGAANRFMLIPDKKAGVIVLSNLSENAASAESANKILNLLLPVTAEEPYTPTVEELERYAGTYRFYDSMDPAMWFLRYAVDVKFSVVDGKLYRDARITKKGFLTPTGPGRFRMIGSMLDESEVYFDEENVYMGYIRAKRIGMFSTLPAMITYAIILVVAILGSLIFFLVRFIRRRFFARNAA